MEAKKQVIEAMGRERSQLRVSKQACLMPEHVSYIRSSLARS